MAHGCYVLAPFSCKEYMGPIMAAPGHHSCLPTFQGSTFTHVPSCQWDEVDTSSIRCRLFNVPIICNVSDGFKGDLVLWVRMLLPMVEKRVYTIQSKLLIKIFSSVSLQSWQLRWRKCLIGQTDFYSDLPTWDLSQPWHSNVPPRIRQLGAAPGGIITTNFCYKSKQVDRVTSILIIIQEIANLSQQ